MTGEDLANAAQVVIVGGGLAGGWAARTLRDMGFSGRVTLLTDEPFPPYDRPPLSKDFLRGGDPGELFVFAQEDWQRADVDVRCSTTAIGLDRARRVVFLSDGSELEYDRLLLATGARVRRLTCPGAELADICYLRTIADASHLRSRLVAGRQLVVIGGGFIGLEVASAARGVGAEVTVVEAQGSILTRSLDADLAERVANVHVANGVTILTGCGVSHIKRSVGGLEVGLVDGRALTADTVVVGIGVIPNTELAAAGALPVDDGILVDELGRTADPAIFAAGDVTRHVNPFANRRLRLEAWENARNQGIAAAHAMLGRTDFSLPPPWLWSDQYDLNIQVVGVREEADRVVDRVRPNAFLRFYLLGACVVAAVAFNGGRDMRQVKRLIAERREVLERDLADVQFDLRAL